MTPHAIDETVKPFEAERAVKPDLARSIFSKAVLTKILEDQTISSQAPHDALRSRLPFTKAESYWWDITGVILGKLMLQASYPLPLCYKMLAQYYDMVLPAWGPIPLESDGKPGGRPWRATILKDGSAFEPSLNLKGDAPTDSAVRYTIECSDSRSGTPEDPLNQKAAHDLALRFAAADPEFDLTVYNYMHEQLFLDDQEAVRMKQSMPSGAPQIFWAFDFERSGKILGKCVLFFHWKAKQLGITQKELAIRVISGVPEVGHRFEPALDAWNTFMETFPSHLGDEPKTECLSFDVVKPGDKSRVKVYIRPSHSSFNSAKHFYTLGGQLNDEVTLKGVELLRLFYHIVLGIKNGDEDKELTVYNEGWGGLLMNVGFTPGSALPVVQFYITMFKFLPTDKDVVERLKEFWRRIGWSNQADRYDGHWQDTFPWLDGKQSGNMGVVSLSNKKCEGGLYQSVYYCPMVHLAARKLGYV